ncbi:MAG TPA: porphobilinogen synthase, partial [Gemmatimonadaceae bacterium]|nr:porphobilinogen synthase [Gemmatimonadaceae bacterium]
MPSFPQYRPRRLRRTEALRNLVRETHLSPSQLVLPVFVRDGKKIRRAVGSMPGVNQTSVDEMLRDAEAAAKAKVGGIILFG